MKHNKNLKVGFCYRYLYALLLLCLAVILQVLFVYHYKEDNSITPTTRLNLTLEPDVISAIKRAKTNRCKQEFIDFAKSKQSNINKKVFLERTCPLDSQTSERIISLGCANQTVPSKNQSLYVTLEESHLKPHSCKEYCFAYNHAYAAYSLALQKCYCADDGLLNSVSLRPCNLIHNTSTLKQLEWFQVDVGAHRATKKKERTSIRIDPNEVRIAFLLSLNGRSYAQILRLLKHIYSRKHIYYIHVDIRQSHLFHKLDSLPNEYDNIILSTKRFETIWGGPALLSMMLNAMEDLRNLDWHYLLNLSESDFPLKSLSDLEIHLATQDIQSIYLKSHNMKGYNFIKKQGLNYDFYQCEGRVWRLGRRQLPLGISYTGGSDWFGLPKTFCDHIIKNKDRQDSLVYSMLQIFNFTLLPAESFFHTLAQNSEFCDNLVDHNLRITNWHRKQGCKCLHEDVVDWCGCSPLIYRWPDWQRLKQTSQSPSLFFSRKFDPTVSSGIIGFVETHLVDKVDVATSIDTRYWSNIYEYPGDSLKGAYRVFGELALSQIHNELANHSRIASIDLYYKEDQFVGIVYQFCDERSTCIELMLSPKKSENMITLDDHCFGSSLKLKSLEISQDFDVSEKHFRNPMPIDSMSDIAVQHVWMVAYNTTNEDVPNNYNIEFRWINPRDEVELIQDAKIKISKKPSKLSLVHRLNVKKPVHSGQWKLRLSSPERLCLEYQFLVVNETSFIGQSSNRGYLNKFYSIARKCSGEYNSTGSNQTGCLIEPSWSLGSKQIQLASYRLK